MMLCVCVCACVCACVRACVCVPLIYLSSILLTWKFGEEEGVVSTTMHYNNSKQETALSL